MEPPANYRHLSDVPAHEGNGQGDIPLPFSCPNCGHEFELAAMPENHILECPQCRQEFFAPDESGNQESEEQEHEASRDRSAEIDAARVKQVMTLRRGLYKTRSYHIVGVITLMVAALQLVVLSIDRGRTGGWGPFPIGLLCAAVACLLGCGLLFPRIGQINQELRELLMQDPEAPPDLSTLNNGSNRWAGLEAMHRPAPPEDPQTPGPNSDESA